jgi:uroporphyrinogen decarboxylase
MLGAPQMTPIENLLLCLRRQGYETPPIAFDLCESQVDFFRKKYGQDDYRAFFEMSYRILIPGLEQTFTDGRELYPNETLPTETWFDPWGVAHSKGSEAAFHMTHMHHPLKGDLKKERIQNYPWPKIPNQEFSFQKKFADDCHTKGLAAIADLACTVWETSWYIRSMEDLLCDMISGEETADILFDQVTAINCERVKLQAKAGFDIILLGDDIGMQSSIMMKVELWERYLKPRLSHIIQEAKKINPQLLIAYHSCGYILPFIEGLIEAGVDILNPIQPESMDFGEIHSKFGDRLSFWGTIGTQTTMPFGTPEDVRNVMTKHLDICGKKGGILIGPTHLVEPEVPWENIMAVYETAKAYKPKG